jgi:MraZ protein
MTIESPEIALNPRFWGEFEHTVDDKGRVVLPQELRAGLGEDFVATRGPDQSIYLFPQAVWNLIEAKLNGALLQRHAGFLQRLFGGRTICKLDPQFRLAVPQHLRDWAEVSRSHTAVIMGRGPYVEVWSKHIWDPYCKAGFTADAMYSAVEGTDLATAVVG